MPENKRPSRLRERIGHELRAARELSGVSQEALAHALDRKSQSFSARVENGTYLLTRPELLTWLRHVGAPRDVRERLQALVEAAHSETQPWRNMLDEREHLQDVMRDRNLDARLVQIFDPTVITGMLQTADYARAIIPIADITQEINHAAALAGRIERQSILREPGRSLQFIITERLLRWEPDDGVLAEQLAHLIRIGQLDAVDLAILPDDYAGALPWHNFALRYPADDSAPYVTAELIDGEHRVDDPESVALYQQLWQRLWDGAATGQAALNVLREAGGMT